MKTHFKRLYQLVLMAVVTITACSDGSSRPGGEVDPFATETSVQGLGTGSRCDTAPADLVWSGGGLVRTNASYTKHNASADCWDAYLIDLNNYNATYMNGTRVTYGRKVPRDQATCARTYVKGHFWRKNADGTRTYLGVKSRRGQWLTNSNLPPRCEVANFVIDRDVPGFVHGGSYRLALTAREDRATDGYDRREIVVETEMPDFGQADARMEETFRKFRTEVVSGVAHPGVKKFFGRRGTVAAGMECRIAQLELSAMRISERSLIQAGALASDVTRMNNSYSDMIQAYCGTGSPTALQLQGHFTNYLVAVNDVRRGFTSLLGVTQPDANHLLSSIIREDIVRIMAGCGTDMVEVHEFVRTGLVPAGIAGPNVLLRNCGGSTGTLQNRLGMTLGTTATISASLRGCIVQAFDEPPLEQQAGACTDPRAQGGGEHHRSPDDPCVTDPMSDDCFGLRIEDADFPPFENTEAKRQEIADWLTTFAYNEAKNDYTLANERADELRTSAKDHFLEARSLDQQAKAASLAGRLAESIEEETGVEPDKRPSRAIKGYADYLDYQAKEEFKAGAADEAAEARERAKLPGLAEERDRELRELCKKQPEFEECPKPNQVHSAPAKRCPEIDLGTGPVWLDRQDGRRLTMADRIATCSCEAMRRGTFTLTGGETSAQTCMTEEERRVFDCQTNPWDEDDGPTNPLLRPECRNAFQPSGLDRDSLLIGLCDAMRCADDQVAVAAFNRCHCLDEPTPTEVAEICNFNGPAGALDCGQLGGNLVCDEQGPRCVDEDHGRDPSGNNPFCPQDGRTTQLGARPAWGESTPNSFYGALTMVQSAPRRAFMMDKGFKMLSSYEMFERTFDEIGSNLVIEVQQPSQLPADKGSVQALCSNPGANVHNVFLGQRELVAGLNTASFTFDARCWGDGTTPMHVGVSVRTATNQASRAALLGMRWGGTIRAVPDPFEECDNGPDPAPFLDRGTLVRLIDLGARPGIIEGTWIRDVNFGGGLLATRVTPVDFGALFQ